MMPAATPVGARESPAAEIAAPKEVEPEEPEPQLELGLNNPAPDDKRA